MSASAVPELQSKAIKGGDMEIDNLVGHFNKADEGLLREALRMLFVPHATPVFGAAKSVEHEVAALNVLKLLGYVSKDADEFELVERLRVTKPKARNLLYQSALRASEDSGAVDRSLRSALSNPRIKRDGAFFLIEVPQPLTMDRLRARVRFLGFISDGTFSGGLAKVPEEALTALVESLMPAKQKAAVLNAMKKQGLTDTSLQGVLKGALSRVGSRVAAEAGGELMSSAGEFLGQVFTDLSGKHLVPFLPKKNC